FIVSGLMATAGSAVRKLAAIKPPITAPTTTIRFHCSSLQSNLKKSTLFPAPPMAHMVLRLDDIPQRFPENSSRNMMPAIRGPETYQGQDSKIHSIFQLFYRLQI